MNKESAGTSTAPENLGGGGVSKFEEGWRRLFKRAALIRVKRGPFTVGQPTMAEGEAETAGKEAWGMSEGVKEFRRIKLIDVWLCCFLFGRRKQLGVRFEEMH